MFKQLCAGALALAGYTTAADTATSTDPCKLYIDWNSWDLNELTTSDKYYSQGLEFNFC